MLGADVHYAGEKIGSFDDMFKEQLKSGPFRELYERCKSVLGEEIEMSDNVNKPDHYAYGKYECIDVIKDITEGNEAKGIEAFCLGNVLKYLWRYKHKNGTEDLKKAKWYLERLIKESEADDSGN